MSRNKLIILAVFSAVFILSVWYFFIKDYNYRITFTTPQAPGIVYDHLIKWNNWKDSTKVITTVEQTPFNKVQQKLVIGDSILKINWVLKRVNDSTTLITAKVKDEKHSLKQNFEVIFNTNDFVKRSISTVKNFAENLIQNGKNYKISKVSEDEIPSRNCACIELESKSQDKANTMVKNISVITDYIKDNNIPLTSNPFLEITEWDIAKDEIKFNFCFPIPKLERYPELGTIKIKTTTKRKALKTIFNGNYKISDRAWYALMDYAENNDFEIENFPVEVYLNDPHSGGNDLEWEAEIYMPLKN